MERQRKEARMSIQAHFGPNLFEFLRELKDNNSRDWFQDNKSRYRSQVQEPLLRFIEDFGDHLRTISSKFVADPRPSGGSMFRIYRDVRFSRDKSPYKTVAAAQFRHRNGRDVHAPGFYLHLEPDNVFAGTGIWHPDGATLAKIRAAIVKSPSKWKAAVSDSEFTALHTLGGESLKRAPRGFEADHPLIEDLRRKDFVSMVPFSERQACAVDFIDQFATACRTARPFMAFLARAIDLKF
jgi:uncharacterized protein (TIGR02453 family)